MTVRAQVLDLFSDLQKRYGFSCLFISHDLGVVEQVADRVVVMQDGRIIEEGDRDTIFDVRRKPIRAGFSRPFPPSTRTKRAA